MPTHQVEPELHSTPRLSSCGESCTPEGGSSRSPLGKPLFLNLSPGNPHASQSDKNVLHHTGEETSHIEDNVLKRLSTLSNSSTVVAQTTPEPTPHYAFLESKFGLAANQVQFVLQSVHSRNFFRKDLSLFLSKNYLVWQKYGVWHKEHYQLTTSNSDTVSRIKNLLSMDVKNENETAVNELRRLIILHRLLIEFDYLKTSFENSVSPEGKRAATSAIDKIVESQEHDRKFVESRLKRSRRLKKITDKLGLATILVAGRHLTTLLQGSTMNDSMFDCLSFYILEEFPFVAKIIEALRGVATGLVDNVPLPPWEEFQALLNKVEGLKPMKDSRTSNADAIIPESWIDKVRNKKASKLPRHYFP